LGFPFKLFPPAFRSVSAMFTGGMGELFGWVIPAKCKKSRKLTVNNMFLFTVDMQ